jgi:hypothetical protein
MGLYDPDELVFWVIEDLLIIDGGMIKKKMYKKVGI